MLQVTGHTAVQARQRQIKESYGRSKHRPQNCPLTLTTCQPDHKESKSTWEDWKIRLQDHAPSTSVAQNTEDLQGVSLPKIEIDHKTRIKDFWNVQSYQKFAGNVERKNPNMVFTKKPLTRLLGWW